MTPGFAGNTAGSPAGQQTAESGASSSAAQPPVQGVNSDLFTTLVVSPIGTPITNTYPASNLPMSSNHTFDDPSHVLGQQGNAADHVQASTVPGGSGCWNCCSGSLVLQYSQYVDMVECTGRVEQQIASVMAKRRQDLDNVFRGHKAEIEEVNNRLAEEVNLTSQYEAKTVKTQHELEQI